MRRVKSIKEMTISEAMGVFDPIFDAIEHPQTYMQEFCAWIEKEIALESTPIKPLFVYVEWSESIHFEDKSLLVFEEFERIAHEVAMGHTTGYLKTQVYVLFDSGKRYECRLDLGQEDCKGFMNYVERLVNHYETSRRTEGESAKEFVTLYSATYSLLRRIKC